MHVTKEDIPGGERAAAMATIARAVPAELEAALDACPARPGIAVVRRPETGLLMVRGRVGGGGAPFNVGEVTATRAAVRLATGEVGFACVLGRDREQALLAATADALWQSPTHRGAVEAALLEPVRARLAAEADVVRCQSAATRVEFFTMVRGEA
jgi:alpha-D-ribose 1-methylphosphonate 5-triphosphate synthase subunit PhnG